MIYRVRLDLAFTTLGIAEGLKNHALGLLDQAVIINPGEENEERGYISVEKCYHDELNPQPCEQVGLWQAPYPPE